MTLKFEEIKHELAVSIYDRVDCIVFKGSLKNKCQLLFVNDMLNVAGRTLIYIDSSCEIHLSETIITKSTILRDVLIHEMCHVAARLLDRYTGNNSHGPVWQKWTKLVNAHFTEIPLISVTHKYAV